MQIHYLKTNGFDMYFKVINETFAIRVSANKMADAITFVKDKFQIREILNSGYQKVQESDFSKAFNDTICKISSIHNVTEALCS